QEGKKEIREVLEEEPLDEKVNKELMEMEKEPVEKEKKEQSRWMQIDAEKELRKEDKREEAKKQNILTEKRNRDSSHLDNKKWKRPNRKEDKALSNINQRTISKFNKKDYTHDKENEATE
ncbi:16417_t:CDS:2, partial [Gigaspora rosea]